MPRELGIGAMTDARMKDFFDKMVRAGVVKPTIDYRRPTRCIRQQGRRRSTAARRSDRREASDPPDAPSSRLRGVGKTFAERHRRARRALDLDVGAGEFLSLLGPVRLRQVDGAAHHRGPERADAGDVDWRTAGAATAGDVGFVFQDPTLMPWATVADNVRLPLKLARHRPR